MKNSDGKAMTGRPAGVASLTAQPAVRPQKMGRRTRRLRRQSDSTGEFEGAPGELRQKQQRPVTVRVLFELSEQRGGSDLQAAGR